MIEREKKTAEQVAKLESLESDDIRLLLRDIAHDAGNRLQVIEGRSAQISRLLKKNPEDTDTAIEFADIIHEASQKTEVICQALRRLSEIYKK